MRNPFLLSSGSVDLRALCVNSGVLTEIAEGGWLNPIPSSSSSSSLLLFLCGPL
jgi:hypothetical protein